MPFDGELHLCSFGATDPVALGLFEALGPVDTFQAFQQTACVGTHAQTPLAHHTLLHGITATDGETFAHLIVCQHRTQFRAPVDFRVRKVRDAVVHQPLLFLALGESSPFRVVGFELRNQFADRLRFLRLGVKITVEHLHESPLRPFVERRVARAHFAVPVIAETDFLELRYISVDVLERRFLGVLTGLDGVLLRRQTVAVKTHRVEHVKALQTFVTAVNIAGNVA